MNDQQQNNAEIKSQIISYLDGSIGEDEKKILEEWVCSNNRNKDLFVSIYKTWIITGSEKGKNKFDTNTAWEDFSKLLSGRSELQVQKWQKAMNFRKLKIAATWLLFFVLGSAVMYFIRETAGKMMLKQVSISVPLGSRTDIILPDGSRVWLNAGTQLTYYQDYGTETRSLYLTGEAFFEVVKDMEHPFIVNASEVKIVALGTKFNVKAYPEEQEVLTTLEEGKLDVQVLKSTGEKTSLIVMPNENIIFHKAEGTLEKAIDDSAVKKEIETRSGREIVPVAAPVITLIKNVNTELYTSWKEERWIIENEPLGTLAPMLERRYNVKIIFKDDQLKKYNFTGTIENETIEQMMTALQLSSPIDFEMDRDVILLKVNPLMQNRFRQIMKNAN